MTDKILDAAEAYDIEIEQWGWRRNKMNRPRQMYEVYRQEDPEVVSPVVVAAFATQEDAEDEMWLLSRAAAMRAALAVLGVAHG